MDTHSMDTSLKVLVLEDEAMIAQDHLERLQELGFEQVERVLNPEAAIRRIDDGWPDILLADINLQVSENRFDASFVAGKLGLESIGKPELELMGIDVGAYAKNNGIAVCFISAYGSNDVMEAAQRIDPSAYVVKPASPQKFNDAIRTAVAQHRDAEEEEGDEL